MAYRVLQPYGKDRGREATEISTWSTIADAFAEVDRYAERMRSKGLPADCVALLVIDDEGSRYDDRTRIDKEAVRRAFHLKVPPVCGCEF
jgi:hypothetical protein